MSGAWLDRTAAAVIVVAAGAYLLRRLAQRVSVAFGRDRANNAICGTDCGCESHTAAPATTTQRAQPKT